MLGTGEERVHSWAREKVKETEVSTGRTGVKSQSNRVRGGEEPEKAGRGQSLNSGASWVQSCRKAAWEGVSTLSNAEVQAFPSDSSQRGTPPPLHLLGGLESAARRGLGFQTTSACMQRVGS